MAGNLQFLSFLNRPSGSGSLTLTLQGFENASPTTITLAVSGIGAFSPQANAYTACQQIATQLVQYGISYSGMPTFTSNSLLDPSEPVFSSQLPMGTYRVLQSEHVLSFFSEGGFSLDVCSTVPGLQVVSTNYPVLATVDEAKKYAPILQLDLTGFTDSSIALLLEVASTRLTTLLGNNIVVCTYVHSEIGYMQRSFFLREGLPTLYYDAIRVKRPAQVYTYPLLGNSLNWNLNRDTGELYWMLSQNIINMCDPTSYGNEIKISYVAGYFSIPSEITFGVITLMQAISENTANIESLKTGTWAVKFKSTVQADLIASLNGYIL